MTTFEEEITGTKADAKPFRDLELESMRHVLATRSGRRLIYALLGVCHYGRSAFGGSNEITNLQAGKQLVGEYVMGLLNLTNPAAFSTMVTEAKEDEEHERRATQQRSTDTGSDKLGPDTSSQQPA